ncbi:hypothetical protein ACFLSI_02150 [Bacteroidota bacterium]
MKTNKLRIIQDYEKLSDEIKEQIKLVYPEGFSDHLIYFTNSKNQKVSALRFETDEKIYMLRMSAELAIQIMDDDSDYDDDYNLKSSVKEIYEEKHSDVEYLSDNENYVEEY